LWRQSSRWVNDERAAALVAKRERSSDVFQVWLVAACLLLLSLVMFTVIFFQDITTVGLLTRDPSETVGEPWYLGAASSLGGIGWSAAVSFFGFAAVLVWRSGGDGAVSLFCAALFSLLMLIDDVFLLHDDILLRLVGSEAPIYAGYVVLAGVWFGASIKHFDRTTFPALVIAVAFLGTSVLIDLFWDSDTDVRLVFEEGSKFAGIWLWALFAMVMGVTRIEQSAT